MLRIFLLALLMFDLNIAQATENDATARLRDKFQKDYAQLIGRVTQINPTPASGLYEVVTEDRIFYTDGSGQFLIDGQLFDLQARRNVTEARSRQLFAVEFDKLPLNAAIKRVKGNGSRKLATFEDPQCSYCKKLAHELTQLDNVTVYTFLYPIFPGSDELVRNVHCAKDPAKAWNDLMLKGIKPAKAECKTPTEQVLALGRKLKVNGTPALIFANGVINPGYMPAAQLDEALNKNK